MIVHGQPLLNRPVHRALLPALYHRSQGNAFSYPGARRSHGKGSFQVVRSVGEWNGAAAMGSRSRGTTVIRAVGPAVDNLAGDCARKRKIVEHVFLIKAKDDLSADEEKDMLDFLYTSQYQMRGILAISLGRIADPKIDGYTHAVFMRFQKKEDVMKFYDNAYYLMILKDHVIPYCYGSICVDYESEVDDDILPIFRRGEEFNYGVEFVILISVFESVLGSAIEDALSALHHLSVEFEQLIVQSTQGSNINVRESEYTHGAVFRFPSVEALEIFRSCPEFKDMWRWKFQPITNKFLMFYFTVDPVGTELM